MKQKIINLAFFVTCLSICILMIDYLFSLHNEYFYFKLTKYNIAPAVGYSIFIGLISSKFWRNLALSILAAGTIIELLYFQYFGEYLPAIAFVQGFTYTADVLESFLAILSKMITPFVIVVSSMGIIFFISNKFDKKMFSFRFSSFLILLFLFINLGVTHVYINKNDGKIRQWQARAIYPNKKENSFFNFNKSINYLLVGIIPKKVFGNELSFPTLKPPVKKEIKTNNNIVLIIGESLRFDRMSLFNYENKTTPFIDSLDSENLLQKKVIFAGGTMTKTGIATILNRLKYPGLSQVVEKSNNIFKLAKDNGYKTHFISSQDFRRLEILEGVINLDKIDNYINRTDFDTKRAGYTGLDEDLLLYLNDINLEEKNFIVFQQCGSHSPYTTYPKEFKKFDSDYDNTVLYTDYVYEKIYKLLKEKSSKETYLIFASDHGELLGEKGKYGHGWFQEEVYKIPFFATSLNTKSALPVLPDSQFELSNLLTELIGYSIPEKQENPKEIYINGSELEGLGGYLKLKVDGSKIISKETFK